MTDLVPLGLVIHSEQAETGEQRLDKLSASAKRTEQATDALATSSKRSDSVLGQMLRNIERAVTEQTRLARAQHDAATAASRQAAEEDRAAKEAAKLAARVTALKAAVDPLGTAHDRLNRELAEAEALYRAGAITAQQYGLAVNTLQARLTLVEQQQRRAAMGARLHGHEVLNLSRQFADVGVSAAMGMNPLMILVQQGPQIAETLVMARSRGIGLAEALRQMAKEAAPFLRIAGGLAAVLGIAAASFGLFHRELAKGYPKDITDGLGLTEEQLKRVESRTVTFGDTFIATFTVVGRRIMESPIGSGLEAIGRTAQQVMDFIAKYWVEGWALQIGVVTGAYRTIRETWRQIPAAIGEAAIGGVNLVIEAIEKMVNAAIRGINTVLDAASRVPGIGLPQGIRIGQVDFKGFDNPFRGAGAGIGRSLATNISGATAQTREAMSGFAQEVQQEAIRRARERALEEAGDPRSRKGSGSSAEDLARRREDLALENALAVAKARNDQAEIWRLEQIVELRRLIRSFEEAGFKDAEAMAQAQQRALNDARAETFLRETAAELAEREKKARLEAFGQALGDWMKRGEQGYRAQLVWDAEMRRIRELARSAHEEWKRSTRDGILDGLYALDQHNFGDFLKMRIKRAAFEGFADGITNALSDLPGDNPIIAIGNALNLIPKHARGTPHAPGGLSLVGEEGPELMEVPHGAKVRPADATRQALAGSVVQVSMGHIMIDARGAGPREIDVLRQEVATTLKRMPRALASEIRRKQMQAMD